MRHHRELRDDEEEAAVEDERDPNTLSILTLKLSSIIAFEFGDDGGRVEKLRGFMRFWDIYAPVAKQSRHIQYRSVNGPG